MREENEDIEQDIKDGEASWDKHAETLGLERVPNGEASEHDFVVVSSLRVSGPDKSYMELPVRYRALPGGLMAENSEAPFTITHEVAEDGGVAVYKFDRATEDKEWICGYGPDEALLFVWTNFQNVMSEWYVREHGGQWPPKGRIKWLRWYRWWRFVIHSNGAAYRYYQKKKEEGDD